MYCRVNIDETKECRVDDGREIESPVITKALVKMPCFSCSRRVQQKPGRIMQSAHIKSHAKDARIVSGENAVDARLQQWIVPEGTQAININRRILAGLSEQARQSEAPYVFLSIRIIG